ncbi:MAG TPA: hypothetical protein VHC90_14490 [Bryobacteraceae bacterium]|nr:hypothetical protein [Bryobacteraceae bacterium]
MRNSRCSTVWLAVMLPLAGAPVALLAQTSALRAGSDASSSVKIDLPPDSPVTLISASTGQSQVTPRGGMLVLDLHMSLTLRNSASRAVRGVVLLITAQEFTPGGKGAVARPCIDIPPGQNFTLPVELKLAKPVQQAGGPLVHVQLDGVLFDDLSFYGPNRLKSSQRDLTLWEVEAERDRAYYKQVLQAKGEEGLRREVLTGLAKAGERPQLDVALSRGRSVGSAVVSGATSTGGDSAAQFAFLRMPDQPVLPVQGQASIAGNEVSSPWIEIQNLSKKPVRYVEIGWVVRDKSGNEYLVGSVPGSGVTAMSASGNTPGSVVEPGQRGRLEPDATMRFSHAGRPIGIDSMTGFVRQVEFADGKVWVPSRKDLDSSSLLRTMAPSTEEQRLLDIYARQGIGALVADLNRY